MIREDVSKMVSEQDLQKKFREIEMSYKGVSVPLKDSKTKISVKDFKRPFEVNIKTKEMQFLFPDMWRSKLFVALCRKYKLEPYRYSGQRHTTVMVRGSREFIDTVLWDEYVALADVLVQYFSNVIVKLICEEIHPNAADTTEVSAT